MNSVARANQSQPTPHSFFSAGVWLFRSARAALTMEAGAFPRFPLGIPPLLFPLSYRRRLAIGEGARG